MSKMFLFVLVWLAAAVHAFPMAKGLDWDEAVRDVEVIARVKIESIAAAPAGSGYKQLAHATITDAAKGPKAGESIDLLSDNGFICPNVTYQVSDDCIVFARRQKSGVFETMNTYAGKVVLEAGSAAFITLRRKIDPPILTVGTPETIRADLNRKYTAEEILAEVRRSLAVP